MPRKPDDKVVPFRKPKRTWTRPEDFVPQPGKRPPRKPPRSPRWLAWVLIAVLVAATVAWSAWR